MSATMFLHNHAPRTSMPGTVFAREIGAWGMRHVARLARWARARGVGYVFPVVLLLAVSGLSAAALVGTVSQSLTSLGTSQEISDFYRSGQNPWVDQLPGSMETLGRR